MDKEFLIDYKAREKDDMIKFKQKFCNSKIKGQNRYPPQNRFQLKEPFTKSIDGEKIWYQIPLYGTTVISLKPTKKENFEKVHGFDIEDLDRLIDLAKETNKVQFALTEDPTHYIEMDYLEPVFMELKPPKLIYIPLNWIVSDKEILDYYNEIDISLENSQLSNFINNFIVEKYPIPISHDIVKRGIIYDLIRLKLLGYDSIIQDFLQSLYTIETTEYISLLESIHDLFLYPHDPLKGVVSIKRVNLNEISSKFPLSWSMSQEVEFPNEIGKFLNDKLKLLVPKNLDGAIELSDEYDLYDLRNVMNALNNSIENKKCDSIIEKSEDVSQILDNVWNEANKVKKRVNIARYGISFGCGVVGALATIPFVGVGGILAGLGFNVADKVLDEMKSYESISEKVLKYNTENYIIHVYDFRKKYKIL